MRRGIRTSTHSSDKSAPFDNQQGRCEGGTFARCHAALPGVLLRDRNGPDTWQTGDWTWWHRCLKALGALDFNGNVRDGRTAFLRCVLRWRSVEPNAAGERRPCCYRCCAVQQKQGHHDCSYCSLRDLQVQHSRDFLQFETEYLCPFSLVPVSWSPLKCGLPCSVPFGFRPVSHGAL